MDIKKESIRLHEKLKGKTELRQKIKLNRRVLSLLYTPGVAEIVRLISKNKSNIYKYTGKGNTVAIISDGSRILGLGNLGAEAALPVMEGKALLYKFYGNVDAVPICLKTQKREDIISIVRNIAPNFGAINIEDIEAPKCFEIVEQLTKKLDIPVFHDDQYGTAIVVAAGLLNALKFVGKNIKTAKIVIMGAGSAGYGITRLLAYTGAENILVVDSQGILNRERENLNKYKLELASITNHSSVKGGLTDAIKDSDVFIGVSGKKGIFTKGMAKKMRKNAIIFALSNPDPEISPNDARKAGVRIIATGRSDSKNQINNAIVFPFFMRKILDEKIMRIDAELQYLIAKKIANEVKKVATYKIIPTIEEMERVRL